MKTMLNYHELTINEPRDSPARRKQFLVICTVMAAVLGNACLTSGVLESVTVSDGTFPGGDFIYKAVTRDPAVTGGIFRDTCVDLGAEESECWDDLLYAVYVDADSSVPLARWRMFGGALVDGSVEEGAKSVETLMDTNENLTPSHRDENDLLNGVKYERGRLPQADALVAQFPFTNGFVSALVHSYKVFPALVRLGRERLGEVGGAVVISTTCSVSQKMCTHYVVSQKKAQFISSVLFLVPGVN